MASYFQAEGDPDGDGDARRGGLTRALRQLQRAPLLVVYLLPSLALLGLGGAPEPVVAALLSVIAVSALLGASRRQPGRRVRVGLLAAALLGTSGWMLLSLLPLPIGWLDSLAPLTAAAARSSHEAAGRPLSAIPWSLRPGDTAIAVGRTSLVLAAALLLPQAVHRDGLRHLHRGLMIAVGALLAVVLWHLATGATLIYGQFEAPGRSASLLLGPFVNANDLAVFACALVPLAVVDAMRLPGLPRLASGSLAALLALVAVFTVSRAATLGLALGLGGVVLGLLWGKRRRAAAVLGAAGIGSSALALAAVQLISPWGHHLSTPSSLLGLGGRALVWATGLRMAASQWVTGVGARAFGSGWWSQRDLLTDVHPEDAESTWVQYVATLGVPASALLLLVALALASGVLRAVASSVREGDLVPLGAATGLGVLTTMSLLTFAPSQPAVAIVALYLLSMTGGEPGRRLANPRRHAAGVLAVALLGAGALHWGAPRTESASDAWFAGRLKTDRLEAGDDPVAMALRQPADPYGASWAAILLRRQDQATAMALVNHALRIDPIGAEPHRAAANVLLAAGLRSQARLEARFALGAATRTELPRLVRSAALEWGQISDLVALLPADEEPAVRVAREFAQQLPLESATALWLALARRPSPPLFAVSEVARLLPPGHPELLLVVRDAALAHPDDPRFAVIEGVALLPDGGGRGDEVLRGALRAPELLDDLWRARALLALLEAAPADSREALEGLKALPHRGGPSEQAVRAAIEGELCLADGRLSEAVRHLARAHRLRPDIERFELMLEGLLQSRP